MITEHDSKGPELDRARHEAKQSNEELARALDHLKEAVDGRAEKIGELRQKVEEKRSTLTHLMGDKRQAAEDFMEKSFKGAEDLLDEKSGMLRDTIENTRTEADAFLKEVSGSLDRFFQDVRSSALSVLDIFEDRRASSFMTAFFIGCLFGSWVSRRVTYRQSVDYIRKETHVFPDTSQTISMDKSSAA